MKRKHILGFRWFMGLPFDHLQQSSKNGGVTLVELLVATLLTSLVVSIAGFGVIVATQANKRTESIAARRYDLSRAFDFMSNEIRMANRINRTQTMAATDSASMSSMLVNAGLSTANWSNSGTPVLYLEIPITSNLPGVCPAGGPNAGSAPATYDQVVYDIRPSSQDWLGPNSIHRYGRIPQSDGSLDPCSDPVASDTFVDAIADQSDETPNCPSPGIPMGQTGFQVCVNGTQVDLFIRSKISDVEIHRLSSTATSRTGSSQQIPVLSGTRQPGTNTVDLTWQWRGAMTGVEFEVSAKKNAAAVKTQIYRGTDLSYSTELSGSIGDQHCYTIAAQIGQTTSPESNEICFTQ